MSYNLQGIITKLNTNMTTEFDRLSYATQNVANMNTNGYKAVRFEAVLDADGSSHGIERVDTRVGEYLMTNNPLDIALQGAGYIPVTTQSGEIRYTRDGSFTVNKDGMLVTKTGDLVGSGIYIDGNAEKIVIEPNGDVYTYQAGIDKGEYTGTIPVVQFQNPEALEEAGASEYIATEDAGKMQLIENHSYIKQNGIERSNIDIVNEVYTISRINASLLASSSLTQAIKDMYDRVIDNITS